MDLNEKQKSFCLEYALGQFISILESTPEETWRRLQCLSAKNDRSTDFEAAADITLHEMYEGYSIGYIVFQIEEAFQFNQQLAIEVISELL